MLDDIIDSNRYTMFYSRYFSLNKESKTHNQIMNKIRTKVFKNKELTLIEEQYLNKEIIKLIDNHYRKGIGSWNIKLHYIFDLKYDGLNSDTNKDSYKNYFKAKSLIDKNNENDYIWIKNEIKEIIERSILTETKNNIYTLFENKRYIITLYLGLNVIILEDKKENRIYAKVFDYKEIYS